MSHHPPISAIYAENNAAQLRMNGTIWTKSGVQMTWAPPFLGGVNVENIGESRLELLQYGEVYVMTYPGAVTHGVLGSNLVLNIEGTATVTCQQTGWSAELMFSGKNNIEGKIYSGEKEISTVFGEWSGLVKIKSDDIVDDRVFLDMRDWTQPSEEKLVKPVSEQNWNESRRLWRKVILCLFICLYCRFYTHPLILPSFSRFCQVLYKGAFKNRAIKRRGIPILSQNIAGGVGVC